MIDVFSREVEVICLRCSTEFRVFSSGFVTFCSISFALAPGYIVTTISVLVSISGYRSIGSLDKEKSPRIITVTKQSKVVIGRFTDALYKLMVISSKGYYFLFATFTFEPFDSRDCPLVTTCTPGSMPDNSSYRSPRRWPNSTFL